MGLAACPRASFAVGRGRLCRVPCAAAVPEAGVIGLNRPTSISALSASRTYIKVEGGGDDEPGGDDH